MDSNSNTTRTAQEEILQYIAGPPINDEIDDPPIKGFVKRLIPIPLRPIILRGVTSFFVIRERLRSQKFQRRVPLQLHLGCARTILTDWVNVDMVGHPVDLVWDLNRPLPFSDNVVDAIFHEHLLEHLSFEIGFALTKECRRVLKPKGVLRIGVPDAKAYITAYVDDQGLLTTSQPGHPTALLALQKILSGYGHRVMYDLETLTFVLKAAGFEGIHQKEYGVSSIAPCPDSLHRKLGTLYVEALK